MQLTITVPDQMVERTGVTTPSGAEPEGSNRRIDTENDSRGKQFGGRVARTNIDRITENKKPPTIHSTTPTAAAILRVNTAVLNHVASPSPSASLVAAVTRAKGASGTAQQRREQQQHPRQERQVYGDPIAASQTKRNRFFSSASSPSTLSRLQAIISSRVISCNNSSSGNSSSKGSGFFFASSIHGAGSKRRGKAVHKVDHSTSTMGPSSLPGSAGVGVAMPPESTCEQHRGHNGNNADLATAIRSTSRSPTCRVEDMQRTQDFSIRTRDVGITELLHRGTGGAVSSITSHAPVGAAYEGGCNGKNYSSVSVRRVGGFTSLAFGRNDVGLTITFGSTAEGVDGVPCGAKIEALTQQEEDGSKAAARVMALISPGDVLVDVNGQDVRRLPFAQILDLLRASTAPSSCPLRPQSANNLFSGNIAATSDGNNKPRFQHASTMTRGHPLSTPRASIKTAPPSTGGSSIAAPSPAPPSPGGPEPAYTAAPVSAAKNSRAHGVGGPLLEKLLSSRRRGSHGSALLELKAVGVDEKSLLHAMPPSPAGDSMNDDTAPDSSLSPPSPAELPTPRKSSSVRGFAAKLKPWGTPGRSRLLMRGRSSGRMNKSCGALTGKAIAHAASCHLAPSPPMTPQAGSLVSGSAIAAAGGASPPPPIITTTLTFRTNAQEKDQETGRDGEALAGSALSNVRASHGEVVDVAHNGRRCKEGEDPGTGDVDKRGPPMRVGANRERAMTSTSYFPDVDGNSGINACATPARRHEGYDGMGRDAGSRPLSVGRGGARRAERPARKEQVTWQDDDEGVEERTDDAAFLSRYLACSDRGWPWAGKDIIWAEYVSLNGHHRYVRSEGSRHALLLVRGAMFLLELPSRACARYRMKGLTTRAKGSWFLRIDASKIDRLSVPLSRVGINAYCGDNTSDIWEQKQRHPMDGNYNHRSGRKEESGMKTRTAGGTASMTSSASSSSMSSVISGCSTSASTSSEGRNSSGNCSGRATFASKPSKAGLILHSKSGACAWIECSSDSSRNALIDLVSAWHSAETKSIPLKVERVSAEKASADTGGERGGRLMVSMLSERQSCLLW